MNLTVDEALKNIDMVVAATSLNREQHNILAASVRLIAERCQLADKLEGELEHYDASKEPEKK